MRSLRSRECGLYEANDLLLGHHLMEKSEAVQWVKVGVPHKRNRRLKKHKELTAMAQGNPDCDEIFEENLVDTHYPQRPGAMWSVSLTLLQSTSLTDVIAMGRGSTAGV